MVINQFHIDDSFGNTPNNFKVFILTILNRLKRNLNIGYLKTGLINKLYKSVTKTFLISEGLLKIVLNDEQLCTQELSKEVNQLLHQYIRYYNSLEKSNFFDNEPLRQTAELTLSNFYKIDSQVRFHAYPKCSKTLDDKNLNDYAATLSLGSLQA